MNDNIDVQILARSWGTSFLISEIRKLAKEIDDCCLPNIQTHYLIDDIQKYKSTKIIERCQNFNEADLKYNVVGRQIKINKDTARECFNEIMEWQHNAVRISESDGGLFDEVIGGKKQRKKRIKKQKSCDDPKWLDPSNQDEVEEEIRRQREKFYEDKGWMIKEKQSHKKYRKLWKMMIKKELGKAARQRIATRKEKNIILRKAARDCSRYCRQRAIASQKCAKDALNRGRRLAREISMCWRQLEKEEKTSRKKADKILTEQKRKNLEMLDAKRQQRKLNYLITQTELYTHFMSRKMSREDSDEVDEKAWSILGKIEEDNEDKNDPIFCIDKAMANVKEAVNKQAQQIQSFMPSKDISVEGTLNSESISSLFQGELKSYQKKGVDWLLYLFEQGINGILADEMGLGKTIQTIAFLATLAEKYDLWGPFLIVAPASTVHNWTQEFHRFLPAFRVIPYWGSVGERKILRRFWNSGTNLKNSSDGDNNSSILMSDSSFHVVVSSYQVVLQDAKMVGRVRWQYLVLDEAHAIKNTSSQRWNTLLSFECRNRLLLTGTPIQNTMQELWALLHFIMPTLFDSHEEFNDWFSRDIESQASAAAQGAGTISKQTSNLTTTKLNATQLSRLHLILQPFMLRRVKTEVEHELPDKIEKMLQCRLSSRQTAFYHRLKRRIRIDDLNIDSLSRQQKSLLNLVMQLRKVCNHPDLVEPRIEQFSVSTRFIDSYIKWPRLFDSFDNIFKPKPLVLNNFLLYHPFVTHYLLYNEPYSLYSFLHIFNIKPTDLYRLMIGIDTRSLINNMHQKLKTLAWYKCFGEIGRVSDMSLFTNLSFFVLKILRTYLKIELLFATENYAIRDWSIRGSDCSRILDSMPTHFGVIATMTVVQPSIAAPVQLGVSSAPRPTLTLSSFWNLFPFRAPVTVEPVSNETRIADSAKLSALDKLLTKLKREGHRVLIYSQMTRMIDIIEDLMRLRCHTFIRLDGSSRLCDRRDMVAEFQTGQELFAFLLSTRAGGLGINLTAADTVIFFDSDWNPTVDQQAMDRAHRLGQNKQVTVYRLVCRDTVEEKILFRAEEKRQMHRMVIAGADLSVDQMRPRDVASLLLEDDEMNIRLEQRRKQATGSRGVSRNVQNTEIDVNCLPILQQELSYSPDEKGGTVTFSESALQKKRRMAWAGVTKGGGRPKKLKLLEPTINNGGVPMKRTPSTSSHVSSIPEVMSDKKK